MSALKEIVEEKRDDKSIVREDPMTVYVGGHPVHCRAFTYRNHQTWLAYLGTMLIDFHRVFQSLDFPENGDAIANARKRFQVVLSQVKVYRRIMRMFRKTLLKEPGNRYWRWRWRKFRREITVQELIDLFFYCYLFNYEAVKKNVTFLLERVGFAKKRGTYISGATENLGGVMDKSIKPRYPNSPSISNGGLRLLTPDEIDKRAAKPRRKSLTREEWEGGGDNGR